MAQQANAIATIDDRSFFEQALTYGVAQGILSDAHVSLIRQDAPKGIVQIANHFGSAYLQASLETAARRMVNLISLYLEDKFDSNLLLAARSLKENSLLSHSRGGSEMLKRLNALPLDTHLEKHAVDAADEKRFVDDRTFASPMTLSAYRQELNSRLETQQRIDFALWLAKQFGASLSEYRDHVAEDLIHSAMLVAYVGQEPFQFPTRSGFVKLLAALRKPSFKPQPAGFKRLLAGAPEDFRRLAESSMAALVKENLPLLRSTEYPATDFIFGDRGGLYFIRESLEEAIGEFDQLVAKEWVKVTKGKSDPTTLATIFLLMATGFAPKASLLKKEAAEIVRRYREKGFDSAAVCEFIDTHAPFEQRPELSAMWLEDLMPEAEIHLADPDQDDTYMERALPYLQRTCASAWKGRS